MEEEKKKKILLVKNNPVEEKKPDSGEEKTVIEKAVSVPKKKMVVKIASHKKPLVHSGVPEESAKTTETPPSGPEKTAISVSDKSDAPVPAVENVSALVHMPALLSNPKIFQTPFYCSHFHLGKAILILFCNLYLSLILLKSKKTAEEGYQ